MKRRSSRRNNDENALDLTPMLDIVFIMLIFFIVTASFIKEVGIDLNKPDGGDAPKTVAENENILIQITNEGLIFIDRRNIDSSRAGRSTALLGPASRTPRTSSALVSAGIA